LGSNTGAFAPRVRPKAGLGVGCGRGSPLPAVRVQGYHPRKIFENSDAKSCILVTTCCEISCFLKTTTKKLGGPIHCWFPQPKNWGISLSRSLGLLRLYFTAAVKPPTFVNNSERTRCEFHRLPSADKKTSCRICNGLRLYCPLQHLRHSVTFDTF